MSAATEVRRRIDAYLDEIDQIIAQSKPGQGLFGFGTSPKNDPCNERFLTGMQSWFEQFALTAPLSDETEEVMEVVFTAQEERRQDFVFFMLSAIHGMTIPLIDCLSPDAAERLAAAYERRIPRTQRMPVQLKLLDDLYRRAGKQPKKRGFFGRR